MNHATVDSAAEQRRKAVPIAVRVLAGGAGGEAAAARCRKGPNPGTQVGGRVRVVLPSACCNGHLFNVHWGNVAGPGNSLGSCWVAADAASPMHACGSHGCMRACMDCVQWHP